MKKMMNNVYEAPKAEVIELVALGNVMIGGTISGGEFSEEEF